MEKFIRQLYRKLNNTFEYCFNIESAARLNQEELTKLQILLADGFVRSTVAEKSAFFGERVVELGPRLNFATPWSSNMVSICHAVGLTQIKRVERSRRYLLSSAENIDLFVAGNHDRMTECLYRQPLSSFETGMLPEAVYEVDLKSKGADVLLTIPGIAMDEWDRNFYYDYFVTKHNRNPTIVEIMDLNNANSEHSRHGFFKGKQIIDGKEQPYTLFELVTETLSANPKGSVIAFKDNSSAITGHTIKTIIPDNPGMPSKFTQQTVKYHLLLTAETHNFPTGIAPFPGAETGVGGRIRDVQGTGRGGYVVAGAAAYCVANLHIPGYELPWEQQLPCPANLASALAIEIEASNGASDYGNKFGEPLLAGFTRSFDLRLVGGERWGFLKPVMFTAGIGQIDARHTVKLVEKRGLLIVQVGGPAYRVGFGGGAASSMLQGENISDLDFNAVQRGDAEMEQKMNRVIRSCNEMGDQTLIDVIHDQGAGGPANVLKELVENSGGRIEIRNIRTGDPTMSVLEIYVAEYQERNGFLIRPENIKKFQAICQREKIACEVLGEVTGDLRFIVHDNQDNSTPVDLELNKLLGNMPTKSFTDIRKKHEFTPLKLPDISVKQALYDVLRLLSVGSKRFLTNKVDRSVSGLVVQQQCCGPLQLAVGNVAVIAQSHFSKSGGAMALGEQAIKMLVDPAAGARMAVGEALTNLIWAKVDDLEQVKCSANWMWAPKLAGEGAAIYDAVYAMCDLIIALGIAVDGGKDSLSMATMVGDEIVKSPRELVISLYGAMADISKVVTPDIKQPGTLLLFIDLADNKNRLGGTSLAHVLKQVGNVVPDLENPAMFRKSFLAVQELIDRQLILAGHDRSDGGLITTLLEMAFSGNCGVDLTLAGEYSPLAALFSEELGLVMECNEQELSTIQQILGNHGVNCAVIGRTTHTKQIKIRYNNEIVLDQEMVLLRQWWEETSYQLERLQTNPLCADQEKQNIYQQTNPLYHLPFSPQPTTSAIMNQQNKPKVAVLRDEGANSDREMTSAFYLAGFEPWDVTMTDLLSGKIKLDDFSGLAAVGGFSYADVPESAKGWASTIMFNQKLKVMFQDFYERIDTFSLGICNGCQLFALLGWLPWSGFNAVRQPRFVKNLSGRFESRWTTVKVVNSRAIMFKNMDELVFGIHVAHGEGRLLFTDERDRQQVLTDGLVPMLYVDEENNPTEAYPFNPNGSPDGIAGLCSADGRHLGLMPHPERAFLPWQAHWLPEKMKEMAVSPWLKMFQNAYSWCVES